MSKVIAIMSMSLDGYIAGPSDGVAEVLGWYLASGNVEIHTGGSDPMTFNVSEASAEHLRALTPGLGPCSPADALSTSPRAGVAIMPGDPPSY